MHKMNKRQLMGTGVIRIDVCFRVLSAAKPPVGCRREVSRGWRSLDVEQAYSMKITPAPITIPATASARRKETVSPRASRAISSAVAIPVSRSAASAGRWHCAIGPAAWRTAGGAGGNGNPTGWCGRSEASHGLADYRCWGEGAERSFPRLDKGLRRQRRHRRRTGPARAS